MKQALIEAAQKKVNDSCAKGITPDIAQVSEGLDKPTQEKLNNLYSRNSKMFDNTAELPVGNFSATSAKPSATLTGKSGRVLDLKAADPDIAKTSPATDFSLEKKPAALLASAKTALLPQKVYAASNPAAGPGTKSSLGEDITIPQIPCPRPSNCNVTVYPDPEAEDTQADCNRKYAEICPDSTKPKPEIQKLEQACKAQYGSGEYYEPCTKSGTLKGSFIGAFAHYLGRTEKPRYIYFDQIDTTKVKPSKFSKIQQELKTPSDGNITITNARYGIGTTGAMALEVGRLTLNLNGTLTMKKSDCTWSFTGTLTAVRDTYDFYEDERGWLKEVITTIGRKSPGKVSNIYILGDKPISENGLIPGCTP